MPVAVIALAAGSFAAGATAFAAAGTLAGMVAAGATMVGSALSIVGTVTGNAKLTRIGAIVGIAGGLGTMAVNASAGAAEAAAAGAGETAGSAATEAAGAAGSAVESAAGTLPVAAPGSIEALGDTASAAGSAADVAGKAASSGSGMLSAATENAAAQGVAGGNDLLAQSLKSSNSMFDPTAVTGQAVTNSFDSAATEVGKSAQFNAFQPQDLLHPVSSSNGMLGSIESSSGAVGSATGAAGGSGFFSGMNAWAKANPELAKMALSGAGSAFGNLVPSAKDKAMMEAYKAQAAATTQQTADAKRKAAWAAGRTTY